MSELSDSERMTELLGAAVERLGPVEAPAVETIVDRAGRRRFGLRRSRGLTDPVGGIDAAQVPIEPTSDPLRGSRPGPARFALAGAGLVALVMLSGLLVRGLQGDAAGAGSPEEAVRALASAVSAEDAVGVAHVLVPAEVRSLDQVVEGASTKAESFGLAASAARPFTGVDLEVTGLELTTDELASGFVKVGLAGGRLAYETAPAEFTELLRRALRDVEPVADAVALEDVGCNLEDCSNRPVAPFLVAEEVDGRWFVSIAYTAFEYWRATEDLPPADFGSARQLADSGAASPEEAVRTLFDALGDLDVERLLTLTPPEELGAAYDYRDAIRTALADAEVEPPLFTVDSLNLEVHEQDGRADVFVTSGGGTIRSTGETAYASSSGGDEVVYEEEPVEQTWTVDHGCIEIADRNSDFYASSCPDVGWFGLWFPFTDTSDSPVVTMERDGRWYVSPVSTVVEALGRSVDEIDRRTVLYMLGLPYLAEPAGTLTLGEPAEGVLEKAYDFDTWGFTGRQGDQVVVELAVEGMTEAMPDDDFVAGSSYGTYGTIYGPDSEGLGYGPAGYPITLPADGEYTLVVEGIAPDGYTVTVRPLDLEVLPIGGEIDGRSETGQAFYALEGSGERIRVTGEAVSPAGGTVLISTVPEGEDWNYEAVEWLGNEIVIDTERLPRLTLSVEVYDYNVISEGPIEFRLRTEVVG